MAKHIGITIPEDLMAYLKTERAIGILATFSEKGLPHTMAIKTFYPKNEESILLSISKDHEGYHNMVWQKKVMLCIIGPNNLVYNILGRAGVVRAPSSVHPFMNVVRIDIIDIKSDESVLYTITDGIAWKYPSEEASELVTSLMDELKLLTRTL